MLQTDLAIIPTNELRSVIDLVLNGLTSPNTRRSYEHSLTEFLTWYEQRGRPGLSKALIQEYRAGLQAAKLTNATINLRLAAIRKLITEAVDNNLMDPSQAASALKTKGLPQRGTRAGFWMSKAQAQALLSAPDITTLRGARDRAILSVLLGGGLRREEITNLTIEHVQQREGRWALVDITGKGSKVRTVPIPTWTYTAIEQWCKMAHIARGPIFISLNRCYTKAGETKKLTTQAVYLVASGYGRQIGLDLATHDCRRSFAKLAYKGGAPVPQIQKSLGHSNLATTERYLGLDQDFENAPCDYLGLSL
jgi:site-specific recombinase XerD